MIRVKKTDGWNKYKIQRRFLFVFWRDISCTRYHSKALAAIAAVDIAVKNDEGLKI